MALMLDQATVKVGRAVLIDRVSISIRPGNVTVMLGANGAGKSTALGVLAGDISPASGRAMLEGRDVGTIPLAELALRRAVVRQHAPMSFPLMVHEVVALARHAANGTAAWHDLAVEQAMHETGILPLAARDYSTLSGGERQRVQIARALAQLADPPDGKPPYLLLDEPTAHLDLKHQITALEIARAFAARGGGVLCILHDIALAREFADDIVLMSAGRLLAASVPSAVLTPANLQTAFGVSEARATALAPGKLSAA
jgi:iron complex transport system ATP-binding protein